MKKLHKSPFTVSSLLLGTFILLGILAYAKPGRIVNEIFILVMIILMIDAACFFAAVIFVNISIEEEIMVEKGKTFTLEFTLTNKAYMISPFIYLQPEEGLRVSLKKEQVAGFLLGPKEQLSHRITYEAEFCGVEELGVEQLILKSFMGFFRKRLDTEKKAKIKIMPEVKPLNNLQHFTSFLREITDKREGEQSGGAVEGYEVGYELRPYMEGDSQNLIHWKLAALKDEYLVRQREGERRFKKEMIFILNPLITKQEEREKIILNDKMLTSFLSLAAYYLDIGQQVKVIYYKSGRWKHMVLGNLLQLRDLQQALCGYEAIEAEDSLNQRRFIKGLMEAASRHMGTKIFISSYWHQDIESYILNQKVNPRLIPVIWTDSKLTEDLIERSEFSFWHMTDEYHLIWTEKSV